MIGQTLNNRYKITDRVGRGAMGTVYRATDSQSGRTVAVKIIASDLSVDPTMLERFRREGETLRQLNHLNIVRFVDAFQYEESYAIIMEYVSGGSLYELLKNGRLPIDQAIQITLDLCDALIQAHRLRMVHRDIKPENVLIAEDGTIKLADFGVARLSEGTRMTRSGMQVGTPYYMAPEAWGGKTLDAQADIWSLGIVLFEMLAGQLPFAGDTPLSVMSKVNTQSPPDLRKLRADVPPGLVRIVSRMLQRNKQRRYQTMREVAVDLERGQQFTTPRPQRVNIDLGERYFNPLFLRLKAFGKFLLATSALLGRSFSARVKSINKLPRTTRWAGFVGLSILVLVILLSRSALQSSPPITEESENPLVLSGLSAGEVNFYTYNATTNSFSILNVGEGDNSDPVLSLSGNLYFTSDRGGKREIYRLINGIVEPVTNTPGSFESWGPAIGRTGNIYFTSNRDGKAEIYRLVDGQPKRVTNTPGDFESWGPVLGFTGNIYFTTNRDGKAEIYRLVDGQPKRVTNTPGDFESWGPAFGVAGNIYFTTNRDGKLEIYRLIDSVPERVTNTPDPFESWGAIVLGQDIYYTSDRSGKFEVYRLGSQAINILNLESWTANPDSGFTSP